MTPQSDSMAEKTMPRLLLLLSLLIPSMAVSQSGPIPATYFDMHDVFSTAACPGCNADKPAQFFGANYGSLRLGPLVSWQEIEPNAPAGYPGCEPSSCAHVYNWTYFDNIVEGNIANGVTDMYVELGYTPTWASSNPTDATCAESGHAGSCWRPSHWQDWQAMITAVLDRVVLDGGTVKYVEAWNEATEGTWKDTAANLALLCQYAQPIVHAHGALLVSPSLLVGSSGTYANWLAAGMGNFIDATAFHGYPEHSIAPEEILSQVSDIKSVNAAFPVMSDKPIVDSEGGWGLNASLPNTTDQAAFVARQFLTEWQTGVQRKYWYAWDIQDWGTLMTYPSGAGPGPTGDALTPAGVAYKQVYSWMVGSTQTSPCAMSSNVLHLWIHVGEW